MSEEKLKPSDRITQIIMSYRSDEPGIVIAKVPVKVLVEIKDLVMVLEAEKQHKDNCIAVLRKQLVELENEKHQLVINWKEAETDLREAELELEKYPVGGTI